MRSVTYEGREVRVTDLTDEERAAMLAMDNADGTRKYLLVLAEDRPDKYHHRFFTANRSGTVVMSAKAKGPGAKPDDLDSDPAIRVYPGDLIPNIRGTVLVSALKMNDAQEARWRNISKELGYGTVSEAKYDEDMLNS
jgi:hypothetical protein